MQSLQTLDALLVILILLLLVEMLIVRYSRGNFTIVILNFTAILI